MKAHAETALIQYLKLKLLFTHREAMNCTLPSYHIKN